MDALTWSESQERACAVHAERPLNTFGTCRHFTEFAKLLIEFFTLSRRFFPRFTDVGASWLYKANFRL